MNFSIGWTDSIICESIATKNILETYNGHGQDQHPIWYAKGHGQVNFILTYYHSHGHGDSQLHFHEVKFSLILVKLQYSNENAKNVAKMVVIILRKQNITLKGIVRFIFMNAIAILCL